MIDQINTTNKIFISYKRDKDDKFALDLASSLRSLGCNVWIDVHDIPPGSNWDTEVETNLNSSKYFLIVLSPEAVKSNHINNELHRAVKKEQVIIPVLLNKCDVPLIIERVQLIDFTTDKEKAFDKLASRLGGKVSITHKEKEIIVAQKETMGLSTVAVGLLSVTLPGILFFGNLLGGDCNQIQESLSSYYYTNMRDLFVAINCIIGAMLISYKGYDKIETIAVKSSGIFCLLMTLFPTSVDASACIIYQSVQKSPIYNLIHFSSFACFLLISSFYPLFTFTKSDGSLSTSKLKRNILFRICGLAILCCITLLVLTSFIDSALIKAYKATFWLESIAFIFFGMSWLVKGRFLFNPPPVRNEFPTA